MTAALYEMLCQAYSYVNSPAYRNKSGESGRTREIRTLTLSYPSGMILEERKRFEAQGNKAINIFAMTLGKNQRVQARAEPGHRRGQRRPPQLHLERAADAGAGPAAVVLHLAAGPRPEEAQGGRGPPSRPAPTPAARRRGRPGIQRPGEARRRGGAAAEAFGDEANEIRIACMDIGGGTTDLMIAKYNFESKIDDSIRGQVLHQDGISLGGDQLVKRLLEVIIVPHFADALGMEDEDVQLLFGPEVPRNREIRAQRVNFINRLFVPLAQAYLNNATDDVTDPISHTDPDIVDPVVVESLQKVCDKVRGPGYYNAQQELDLVYDRTQFEGVVYDVFDELLFDFCRRITELEADVVLLAGLPSKLGYIQQLVKMYVPLSPTRIVPMHNHYAGNWYPYQDEKGHNPGVIVDPKSPVVVGAAIEFMARHGMLPQFKFEMKGRMHENTYYWGVMTDATSGIRPERILFTTAEDQSREEITEFSTSSQRVLIGRKASGDDDAQATPIYLLKMDVGDRIGPTEINVRIKRKHATREEEETLTCESVTGLVAGEDAILDENVFFGWRTLADERYYLDTGGLDNIELGSAANGDNAFPRRPRPRAAAAGSSRRDDRSTRGSEPWHCRFPGPVRRTNPRPPPPPSASFPRRLPRPCRRRFPPRAAPPRPAAPRATTAALEELTRCYGQLGLALEQANQQVLAYLIERHSQAAASGAAGTLAEKLDALAGKLDRLAGGAGVRRRRRPAAPPPPTPTPLAKAALQSVQEKLDQLDAKLKALGEKAAAIDALKEAFVPTLVKVRDGLASNTPPSAAASARSSSSSTRACGPWAPCSSRWWPISSRPRTPPTPRRCAGDWQEAILGRDLAEHPGTGSPAAAIALRLPPGRAGGLRPGRPTAGLPLLARPKRCPPC